MVLEPAVSSLVLSEHIYYKLLRCYNTTGLGLFIQKVHKLPVVDSGRKGGQTGLDDSFDKQYPPVKAVKIVLKCDFN